MSETVDNIELKVLEYLKENVESFDEETQIIKKYTSMNNELNSLFNGVALRYLSKKYIYELNKIKNAWFRDE